LTVNMKEHRKSADRVKNQLQSRSRGQAIVEFAIALPVLLVLIIGTLEVGRLLFIYATISTASREAVRFGSTVGVDESGNENYRNCSAIRSVAKRAAYFLNLQNGDITIQYDTGPSTTLKPFVCDQASGKDPDVILTFAPPVYNRILVTVSKPYSPYLQKLIPFTGRTISTQSARTITGVLKLSP